MLVIRWAFSAGHSLRTSSRPFLVMLQAIRKFGDTDLNALAALTKQLRQLAGSVPAAAHGNQSPLPSQPSRISALPTPFASSRRATSRWLASYWFWAQA